MLAAWFSRGRRHRPLRALPGPASRTLQARARQGQAITASRRGPYGDLRRLTCARGRHRASGRRARVAPPRALRL